MREWLNWPAWKASKRQKRFRGSNPSSPPSPAIPVGRIRKIKVLPSFLFSRRTPGKTRIADGARRKRKMRKHLDAHPFLAPKTGRQRAGKAGIMIRKRSVAAPLRFHSNRICGMRRPDAAIIPNFSLILPHRRTHHTRRPTTRDRTHDLRPRRHPARHHRRPGRRMQRGTGPQGSAAALPTRSIAVS